MCITYYLRTTNTEGIRFNPIEMVNGKICLTGTADSSYNNATGRTTCGGTIALGFNLYSIWVFFEEDAREWFEY